MIAPELSAKILLVAFSLIVLYWVYFIELRKTINTTFRTELFKLRAELFDQFRAEGISYEHEAHLLLRSLINGLIRNTDVLHPVNLIITILLGPRIRKNELDVESRLNRAVETLPGQDIKHYVMKLHYRVAVRTLLFVAFGSVTGFLCVLALFFRAIIIKVFRHKHTTVKRQVYEVGLRDIERRAERYGSKDWAFA